MTTNEDRGAAPKRRPIVRYLILIILLPLAYSIVSRVAAGGRDASTLPEAPPVGTPDCVEPKEIMRFRHMDLLKEMRIDAVRDGNRGAVDPDTGVRTDITFDKCTECHASRAAFCDRCHLAVNLEPDCFGCHWYPE